MIPRVNPTNKSCQSWQRLLADGVSDITELLTILDLSDEIPALTHAATKQFPLRVPRGFVAKMKKGDRHDPLLQQVLPIAEEMQSVAGYSRDPLAEREHNPVPGILHKYHGRVLFTLAGACAINCRYCFRRHFPYADNNPGKHGWADAIRYLENDTSISEVIFSGGDPLLVSDERLASLIQAIEAAPHIKRLRIHTRMPIVLPERVTPRLLDILKNTRLKTVMVLHCNHANEIDAAIKSAALQLKNANVHLLNQSVLLKGINDSVTSLKDLNEALFEIDVLPYYLHLLDKIDGAAHFDTEEHIAKQLMNDLMAVMPGYLVPKLVKEVAGAAAKVRVI